MVTASGKSPRFLSRTAMCATRRVAQEFLVGREAEQVRINDLLVRARAGQGGALVLRGEPGIGKSALLAYARTRAEDAILLSARGLQAESDIPFSGLSALLAPVLQRLANIPAPQRAALEGALAQGPAVPGDRFTTYVGILSLLAAAAADAPVLVSVDDAQWLDSASAEALPFVARRLTDDRIAVLVAVRDGETGRFDAEGLPELRLGGLGEQDAHALMLAHHDLDFRPAVIEHLWRATAGNPLALLELPGVLSTAQVEGQEPLDQPLPLGPSLKEVYRRRIVALPERTCQALTLAAASDSGALREISRALEVRGLGTDALEAAEREGVVTVSAGEVVFQHPLIRSASYHASAGPERRAAHEALAKALEGERSPGPRAWHRAAAALAPDERVAQELEQAADEALGRGAPAAAASAREVAARLSPGGRRTARAGYRRRGRMPGSPGVRARRSGSWTRRSSGRRIRCSRRRRVTSVGASRRSQVPSRSGGRSTSTLRKPSNPMTPSAPRRSSPTRRGRC